MTALVDLSDLVNLSTGGNSGTPDLRPFFKIARHDGAAVTAVPILGRPYSLWRYDGSPGPGAAPTTWVNPDNTTSGGLEQADPGGGRQKWLLSLLASGSLPGALLLYDRLGHNGNLDATVTSAQSFTGSITRYTDGIGNWMWMEIYGNTTTILGATARTMTVQYDAPEGTNHTSPAVVIGGTAFREGNQARLVPLAAGDTGVIAVDNVDIDTSTGTAGAFGITIAHPLAWAAIGINGAPGWRDFATGLPGIPEIMTDACLSLLWMPGSVTAPDVAGTIFTVEK